jgi:hypothetical protein
MLRQLSLAFVTCGLCFAAQADPAPSKHGDHSPLCQAYVGKVLGQKDGKDQVISSCQAIEHLVARMEREILVGFNEQLEGLQDLLIEASGSTLADLQREEPLARCELQRERAIYECTLEGARTGLVRLVFERDGSFREVRVLVPSFEHVFAQAGAGWEFYQPFKDLYLDLLIAGLRATARPNESIEKVGPGIEVVFKAVKTG